jgi:small subunit ribosomal protein S17
MEKTKTTKTEKKKESKVSVNSKQKNQVKLRGRTFEGTVINKLHGRITIEFERLIYISKYERYEKRKTKIHARLPKELEAAINVGDWVEVAECRPLSSIIKAIATKKIRSAEGKK